MLNNCKPSGTVSQLCDTASGIHTRHSNFYIRRVRADNKDPLTSFLMAYGVPSEPDVTKPETTTVFSFPMKAPKGALVRDDVSALEHLKLWLIYQEHWCEHKPSITVSVKEEEWMDVGAFVYQHFDKLSGVSFLPFDGGTYRQAPYEECDEQTYLALRDAIPNDIPWHDLRESTDNVEGVQTLACQSGVCEI